MKVFLSSAARGLEGVRAQIVSDLRTAGYYVVSMEAFGARPELPLDVCLKEMRKADVAVVIIGPYYGSLIPGGDVSYTHAEFREAQRRGVPVLAFILDNAPDIEEAQRLQLDEFRAEAGVSLTYQRVAPTDRLSAAILASLMAARDRGDIGTAFRLFQPWEQFFRNQLVADSQRTPLFNHLSSFVGRSDALQKLSSFVGSDDPAIVVSAPGGAGKSRLLLELARQIGARIQQASLDA